MSDKPPLNPLTTVDHVPLPVASTTVEQAGEKQSVGSTEANILTPPACTLKIPGYRIISEIARGGMGRVYAAVDVTLDREVAIKTALPGASADRFITESKITAKLPHPGIPPVHALGTLADGTPYLVMKLIRGSTLADELQRRTSPREQLSRFVQIFEQIAQAVSFAHVRGIVHRDLKPLNVMVGEFGEVQVMDWGLAKDLTGVGADANRFSSDADNNDAGGQHTATGAIIGTPGYMSPEQARGEVVNARADVFALGATLAAILTGQPAFVGTDRRETIEKAAAGDLDDVFRRLDACGADDELVALAKQCLAAKADDRPEEARLVASSAIAYQAGVEARLRQAETERAEALVREAEQRKRRRQRTLAVALVLVSLVTGLGVSLWQMNRAIRAEGLANTSANEAQRNAAQAVEALESLTDDVVQRKFAQGQGYTLSEDDKAFLRTVQKQWEAFASIGGDDVENRAVRARGRFRVGLMRNRLGELKDAEADYDAALELYKELLADDPSRLEFRRGAAITYNNRGLLLRDTGRLRAAEADTEAALALWKQLAADFPRRHEFSMELAGGHDHRARLLHVTGRLKESLEDYEAAFVLMKELADRFPTHSEYREALAVSHHNRGTLLSETGRVNAAETDYDAAVAIYKKLVGDFPNRPEFQQSLAASHNNRGNLLDATGRLQEAEADYDDALALRKQLAADFPAQPQFRDELAANHKCRGDLLDDTGRTDEAEAEYEAALILTKQLVADFPARPEFRSALARSHSDVGARLVNAGQLRQGKPHFDAAIALKEQLVTDFPTRPEFRRVLAISYMNRGHLLRKTGQPVEAEADYEAALTLRKQLTAEFPNRPEFREELADSYAHRGSLRLDAQHLSQAEADLGTALQLRELLAADYPNNAELRNDLAGNCVNCALYYLDRVDFDRAKELLKQGEPHHAAALKANPRHPDYRLYYRNCLVTLTAAHAGLLEKEEAVRTAESIRELGWNPPVNAYDAACALCRSISIVARHAKLDEPKLDEPKRQDAADFYRDEAMKLLREAVDRGFRNVAHMKRDTDLDPLRSRNDFQTLIADLEGKGK